MLKLVSNNNRVRIGAVIRTKECCDLVKRVPIQQSYDLVKTIIEVEELNIRKKDCDWSTVLLLPSTKQFILDY